MNIQDMLKEYAQQLLSELVARVCARVPVSSGNVSVNTVNGNLLVCSSFLSSPRADTIDLCVEIEEIDDVLHVSADLVRGGSGQIFSEMTPFDVPENEATPSKRLVSLDEFVRAQEQRIVAVFTELT